MAGLLVKIGSLAVWRWGRRCELLGMAFVLQLALGALTPEPPFQPHGALLLGSATKPCKHLSSALGVASWISLEQREHPAGCAVLDGPVSKARSIMVV